MNKKIIYPAVALIVLFVFYKKVYTPKHNKPSPKVIANSTIQNSSTINGIGNIGAKDIYKIGSIYGGEVLEFDIDEGDFIKKGTLIAKIDSVDLKDKIKELEESIKKTKSDIKALEIDRDSAVVQYELQKEIYKKNKKLFDKHALSELDFKRFETNQKVAKLKIESVSSKISSLKYASNQIQANLKGLTKRLSRYDIYAPIDGYITKKYIANHQIINPNQTLIEIISPKDIWIKTYIDTRKSGNIKIGDKATITLRSGGKYSGYVAHIKPYNNSVTYEREVDVKFDKLPIPFYLEEQAIVDIL